jgi:sec-independent protein translocase protein TatA
MTPPLLAFSMPGGPELIFILVIVLLLFGAKKLPELAKGLGQSLGEFKKAREEFEREIHKPSADVEVKPAPDKELFTKPALPAEVQGTTVQEPPKTV